MARKSSLYSLLFTMFNDGIGWGVVLTIFAPMLMTPAHSLLSSDASLESRTLILGFLIGTYALAQFFFMPIIGALSDHWGRKKILEWTLLANGFSFALSAFAVWKGDLLLLFFSRFLAGVLSGNSAVAQAAIADMSSEREKAKNLSLGGIVGGLSWVVGPPIGGFLSTSDFLPWATFATPLWIVGVLFLINYVWIKVSFQETFVKKEQAKHNWKQEIKDLLKLSKIPHMNGWLTFVFFFYLGWGFYILFYPTLLVQRFRFDQTTIGLISSYLSLFWLIASTALNRGLANRFKPQAFILTGLPIIGLLTLVLAFATAIGWWYLSFPLIAICGAMVWINFMALLSNLAGRENQGKVFGITQSLMSLAMFLSPILSGSLASVHESLPLSLSGFILTLLGGLTSLYYFQKRSA